MSSTLKHWVQNVSLITLSIVLLPYSTVLLGLSFLLRPFFAPRKHVPSSRDPKVVLVTGVSMTKGLTILQLLAKHSNSILIGADTSPYSPGRVSRYCTKFQKLPMPNSRDPSKYIQAMLDLVARGNVDLWISCSGVSSAAEDAQVKEILDKRTSCKSIQFDTEATSVLHEKSSFIAFVRDECGLAVPETMEVTSHEEALQVLLPPAHLEIGNGIKHHAKTKSAANRIEKKKRHEMQGAPEDSWWLPKASSDRQFILKPQGVDDRYRADMTLLPFKQEDFAGRKGVDEVTRDHIMRLPISKEKPWLLQEFIRGKEFCTHSLVVGGVVKAFLACPSAELLMHYEALPPPSEDNLTATMLRFTRRVAEVMQKNSADGGKGDFTGHLSFDFLVKDVDLMLANGEVTLYPIECNPRAHTAAVLFKECPAVAQAYFDVITDNRKCDRSLDGKKYAPKEPFYPSNPASYYWLPHDIVTLLIMPPFSIMFDIIAAIVPQNSLPFQAERLALVVGLRELILHVLFWRDGSYTLDDPLPAFWLYHIYWPMQFANSLWTGKRWSRVNISTTKMFVVE